MNIHSASSTVVDEMHEDEVHRGCAYISIFHVIFVESVGVVGGAAGFFCNPKGFWKKSFFQRIQEPRKKKHPLANPLVFVQNRHETRLRLVCLLQFDRPTVRIWQVTALNPNKGVVHLLCDLSYSAVIEYHGSVLVSHLPDR